MTKRSSEAKDPENQEALIQAEIDQTVGRLFESFRDFLLLLIRLSKERVAL